jgi:NACHT domain-containing protein
MVNRAKRPDGRHLLAAARHPALRDGVIALTLFLLPWTVPLVALRHHLDAGTMVAVISAVAAASIGLSTLWLTWAALREARRSEGAATGLNLGQVADQLAVAVGAQWEAEAAIRRLNDPYPLPVSWTAADPSLTDSWESLVTLATSGAGWPPPEPGRTWAAGQGELAGEGGQLVNVLARVPTGRLVVLGEPGAGKTMLMVRLVLDLLARRTKGGPVPFLASIASWNSAEEDLHDWLGAQLLIDHPVLASPRAEGMTDSTGAAALLASGLILPVLDGLDEIPDQARGSAISRINDALRPGERVVVTCRSREYWDAVRSQDGAGVTLRGAAAVQLCPLDARLANRDANEQQASSRSA